MTHERTGSEASALCVTIEPLQSLLEVERDWRGLESRSDRSFFISWSWKFEPISMPKQPAGAVAGSLTAQNPS